MQAASRLQNELSNIRKTRSYGFYARPHKKDLFRWACQIHYNGHFYQLDMHFEKNYPLVPPRVVFRHSVYHPNVYYDNSVCLDILSHKWCATMTVMDVLHGLARLLEYPNPASPANSSAAAAFLSDKDGYCKHRDANNRKHWAHYRLSKD